MKITMYELYGKIYDENPPKHIKVYDEDWYWNDYDGYVTKESLKTTPDAQIYLMDRYRTFMNLDKEVEIIEEEPKPITKESIEALGYACGEIRKLFENGWNKSLENKPLIEEPKKIEKISWREKESLAGNFTTSEKQEILARRTEKLKSSFNKLIDEINNLKEK